jgi:hypothetical protein
LETYNYVVGKNARKQRIAASKRNERAFWGGERGEEFFT